ncbi:MAG: sulfatase [Saprospiraceae bacterium]|nr:sulfatase [Saprospiraceae bacterium]
MYHHNPHISVICCLGLSFLISCGSAEQEAPRPNILFAIADDASYPHMGAYGTDWVHTPAFDQVARHGLLFNNAYTPNAKCAPSRACILTGRNSWQLEDACNHMPFFPEKFITFGEALPKADYFVGHTAKGWAPGEAKKDGIPRILIGPPYNEHTVTPPAKYISGNDYARNFESFLDARPVEQPFFFWYGSTEPHRAYEYGAGLNKGRKSLSDIDVVPPFWPDSDTVRTDMLDYAFEIEYFDDHLGQMLALLESRELLANTLVVVTADNGMPFPRIKGQVYEMDNHLPLAMMWLDGIKDPGRNIDDYVSFIDFTPTFLELAGLAESESTMQPITGHSLTSYFQDANPKPLRDFMIVGKERHDIGRPHDWGYPVRGIIKNDLLYTENFKPERWPAGNPETGYLNTDGSPTKTEILDLRRSGTDSSFWKMSFGKRPDAELYNIAEDPYCLHNIIDDPAYSENISEMKSQMYAQLKEEGDPRILGHGDVFDEYPAASKSANFYDRWLKGEKAPAGWVNESDFEPMGKLKN